MNSTNDRERPLQGRVAVVTGASRGHQTDEERWHEQPSLARTESPRYLGRAVVALAADPAVMERSGQVLRVADLARAYGFTDIDGRQVAAFELDEQA